MSPIRHRRKALTLLVALALASPAAQADVFEDAWQCASAVVDGVALGVTTGAKALKFVATKPQCVSRLGTPATAAPIGVVVGLANLDVLSKTQPKCSGEIFGVAAKPIAAGLNGALGELGVLPASAQAQLSEIAAGELTGAALAEIPGLDAVTGSLTCGCDLVDAGLSIDAIEEVVNTADRIGDQCGGEVWATTKEIAGAVVDFAGDAAEEGVRQVSNLGDTLAGQSKHVGLQQYFDSNWAPSLEHYASVEFAQPGSWHGGKNWKGLWDPCVSYFDTHTMSEDNAQDTCDDMRSGTTHENGLFAGNGFQQRMFRRVFDFAVTGEVNGAREQAYTDFADAKPKFDIPQAVEDDSDAYAQIAIASHKVRPGMIRAAIDEVFGKATKEKKHNGLAVQNATPPTTWAEGTVGDRAAYFYDEVKVGAGDGPADAAKAVQLAMADIDVETQIRLAAGTRMLAFYNEQYKIVKMSREIMRDKDQESVDALIRTCPSQSCKDQIASEYTACRAESQAWYQDNAALIGDFDSSSGKAAGAEWSQRVSACLEQARTTARESRYHVNDAMPPTTMEPVVVPNGPGKIGGTLDLGNRAGGDDSAGDESARENTDENEPLPDPRQRYRRENRTGEALQRDDALQTQGTMQRRLRVDPRIQEAVPAADQASDPVRGDELPGCSAVRGAMRPRVYQCESDSAYQQCLITVRRDSNVQCENAESGAPRDDIQPGNVRRSR